MRVARDLDELLVVIGARMMLDGEASALERAHRVLVDVLEQDDLDLVQRVRGFRGI